MADKITPSIIEIIDRAETEKTAKRSDTAGLLAKCVLTAPDPDARFQDVVRPMFRGFRSQKEDAGPVGRSTRRKTVTWLAAVFFDADGENFKAERERLKQYLVAHSLCGPGD